MSKISKRLLKRLLRRYARAQNKISLFTLISLYTLFGKWKAVNGIFFEKKWKFEKIGKIERKIGWKAVMERPSGAELRIRRQANKTLRSVHTQPTKPKTSSGCSPASGYVAGIKENLCSARFAGVTSVEANLLFCGLRPRPGKVVSCEKDYPSYQQCGRGLPRAGSSECVSGSKRN